MGVGAVIQIDVCKCGIARDDCDYHRPEQDDFTVHGELIAYFPGQVYKGVEYRYVGDGVSGNGQWEIVVPEDSKEEWMRAVGKQVGDQHAASLVQMMVAAYKGV